MENDNNPQNSDLTNRLEDLTKRIADLEALAKTPRPSPLLGKPGCKDSTADIAAYGNERRPGMSWKDICNAWKSEHPDDVRSKTLTHHKVREAWRRHYGDKRRREGSE